MNLIPDTDPILHSPTTPVTEFNDELDLLIRDMLKCMRSHNGLGLAAPQVGISKALIVLDFAPTVIINPKLISQEGHHKGPEGCLSFPGLFLNVARSTSVEIEYFDNLGLTHQRVFTGLQARCVLHEIDHLEGKVFTKRVPFTEVLMAKKRKR